MPFGRSFPSDLFATLGLDRSITRTARRLELHPDGLSPPQPTAGSRCRAGSIVLHSFSAEIVPHTTESLIAALSNCANQGVEEVHLLLSTPGGHVMSGINLYNVMQAMPFRLITHNVGNVDSIGNAVFLAGDHRVACPHSTFMFHGVGFDAPAAVRLEEKFLRERLDGILADQNRIAGILADRTALTSEEIKPLFLEAKTKDAAYAVRSGIVHEIADVEIPAGAPVISLVFQR